MRLALGGRWATGVLLAASLAGCRGTTPSRNADPSLGMGALLMRGRLITPTGDAASGRLHIDFESDSEVYRLKLSPVETTLYAVEPGIYRYHPTRGIIGLPQTLLRVVINGRGYKTPFPMDILRRDRITVGPGKVVPLGILEARIEPVRGTAGMKLSVRLDDSVAARRALVQEMIHKMLDAETDPDLSQTAIAWTRALDQALVVLQGSSDRRPAFKPGNP